MISDADLYRLAMFLGSCSMMMVVLYHFLEVNAYDDEPDTANAPIKNPSLKANGGGGIGEAGTGMTAAAAAGSGGGTGGSTAGKAR